MNKKTEVFFIHHEGSWLALTLKVKILFPTKSVAEHLFARGHLSRARLLEYCI